MGSEQAPKYQTTWAVNSANSLFWIDCLRGDASQVSDNQHSPDIHSDYNRCLYARVRKHAGGNNGRFIFGLIELGDCRWHLGATRRDSRRCAVPPTF